MYAIVKENLEVQKQALKFLHADLQEEYAMLQRGELEGVETLDQVITGLVQTAFEARVELKRLLGGKPLRDYISGLDNALARPVALLLMDIEMFEERCRQRSERNRIYARALDEAQMLRIGALYGVMTGSLDVACERIQ